jgi:hypothetical protein|tara:strand:+ start:793 stop:1011 length:219 start_codon:yes stop_codon:yes gene_type:complete
METLKSIWKKINPRAVVIGGVLVVTTSFGTCQLTRTEAVEPVVVEEVVVESLEDAPSADVQASEEEEVSSVE